MADKIYSKSFILLLVLIIGSSVVLLPGCSSYQKKIGRENWVTTMASSALTSGEISYRTRQFLVENAINEDFEKDPERLLRELVEHLENPEKSKIVIISDYNDVRPLLNVIIELCMYQAENSSRKDAIRYWTSCSFYSYRLLFDHSLNPKEMTFDYLSEVAALRYYNISSSEIFSYLFDNKIPFDKETELPAIVGNVKLGGMLSNLFWLPDSFQNFTVAYDYIPTGLNSHSFNSGLGVPLIAAHDEDLNLTKNKEIALLSKVYPITFVIRYGSFSFNGSTVLATPEFYDDYKTETIDIGSLKVPLAKDFSIMFTSFLGKKQYISGFRGMLNSQEIGDLEGLYMISPYDENKIPVVLVHGLMSAPRTWVQVVNTLLCSSEIREHYQFWLYAYPTGQPVYFSASGLRRELLEMRKKYDPEGKNPSFNKMVIIGHSMGGLLTRLMVQSSNGKELLDKFLKMNSIKTDFDKIKLSSSEKEFVENLLVFDSLPFVKRVVFVATPHRGAGFAKGNISRLGSWLITLPIKFTSKSKSIFNNLSLYLDNSDKHKLQVATSIDNLEPDSLFVESFNSLRIRDDVTLYSIIGDQDGNGGKDGTDGIVPYSSSHIEGVKSELIIKSGHNVQTTPECSREIRRILMEHLK